MAVIFFLVIALSILILLAFEAHEHTQKEREKLRMVQQEQLLAGCIPESKDASGFVLLWKNCK